MYKISVVTISYNQARYLRRAIESVLSQSLDGVEYIVLDAGSTDGSREIISEYGDRISKIVFEKDAGPADGLNKGLELASAEIFYYLNSDDEIMPNALKEAYQIMNSRPDIDVLYGNGQIIDQEGCLIRNAYSSQFFSSKLYARGLAVIVQQAAFMKTSSLRAAGGFNAMNRTSWDGEAFFTMARSGARFKRAWRFWGKFRIYPETISGSGRLSTQTKIDHDRLYRLEFDPTYKIIDTVITKLIWICIRLIDLRRWSSYFLGPLRPEGVAHSRYLKTPKY